MTTRVRDRIRVGRQGRLVLPAAARKRASVQEGTDLVWHIDDQNRIVLERPEQILARLQEEFSGNSRSAVDELIAERREEAEKEEAELRVSRDEA